MKKVNILGGTGSIGASTLDIISQHPQLYELNAISAGSNHKKLIEIAKRFSPKYACITDENNYSEVKAELEPLGITVFGGENGLLEMASLDCDITMSAITGFAALKPTITAMKGSKRIALANKESLVCAGVQVLGAAQGAGVELIPVDSEHNALYQVFEQHNADSIVGLTITASGGAFRDMTLDQMREVTPEMAIKHPNWDMGAKITVDCATLANKGLEYIEACMWFPQIKPKDVHVIVHRQSIIHGMVHYADGSVLAQLSVPDMRTPISYAMAYPSRIAIEHKTLDLVTLSSLTFEAPDNQRFPMLKLAQDSMMSGKQTKLIAFNTANEIAVGDFLNHKIGFLDINAVTQEVVSIAKDMDLKNLDDVYSYNEYIVSLSSEISAKKAA